MVQRSLKFRHPEQLAIAILCVAVLVYCQQMEFDYKICNLSEFNGTQLRDINLAMSITGGLGALLAGIVLLALLCTRAYKTVLQRLFIFTVLALILQEACHAANIEQLYQYNQSSQEEICDAIGFIASWSGWCLYVLYLVIILYLLVIVCVQIGCLSCTAVQRSKSVRVTLELSVVTASLVGPALVLWVPYRDDEFGFNGYYCFMKQTKAGSCIPLNITYRFFFDYLMYGVVGSIAVIIALGMIGVYCMISNRLQSAKHLVKYLTILLIAIIINMMILILMFVIDTYSHANHQFALRVCFAIFATVPYFFVDTYWLFILSKSVE